VFRLRGGLPGKRGRGDQLVQLQVETPVGLDERAQQRLQDFVAACDDSYFPRQAEFRRQLKEKE
jgi:DnaJ-class molecular chaperone